jgi:membrane fusion protein
MIKNNEKLRLSSEMIAEVGSENVRLRIFRSEVWERGAIYHEPDIIISTPIRNWLIFGFVMVMLCSMLAIIAFGHVSRKAHTTGIIISSGGSATVGAPVAGLLTNVLVSEGQLVAAGDTMFEISQDKRTENGSSNAALREQMYARRLALAEEFKATKAEGQRRLEEVLSKLAGAQRDVKLLEIEKNETRSRYSVAQNRLQRVSRLTDQGFYSLNQREDEEEKVSSLKIRLNSLDRSTEEIITNIQSLNSQADATKESTRSNLAQITARQAQLSQEIADLDSRDLTKIIALKPGRVTNIAYSIGQNIPQGQVLASLIPDSSKLEVHLYVPNRAIGRIKKGQKVSIRYHAFPYEQYGRYSGIVVDLGRTPFAPTEIPNSIASTVIGYAQKDKVSVGQPEGLYRVRVSIDPYGIRPESYPITLKPGMTLDADIIVGNVKIWEWMFEPFKVVY